MNTVAEGGLPREVAIVQGAHLIWLDGLQLKGVAGTAKASPLLGCPRAFELKRGGGEESDQVPWGGHAGKVPAKAANAGDCWMYAGGYQQRSVDHQSRHGQPGHLLLVDFGQGWRRRLLRS